MNRFRIDEDVLADLERIMVYLREKAGADIARRVIRELYKGMGRVGRVPGSGHRRPDLTEEQLLFYTVLFISLSTGAPPSPFR